MTTQHIIVLVIVAAAVLVAARSLYRMIRNRKSALNPCSSCRLREQCERAKATANHTTDCPAYDEPA